MPLETHKFPDTTRNDVSTSIIFDAHQHMLGNRKISFLPLIVYTWTRAPPTQMSETSSRLLGAVVKWYGVPHPYPLGSWWALFASGIFLG